MLRPRHYSYECKVTPQERPYKARPSRSQQLRNPKLVPKLHEDTFNALQIKEGVADQELAKREAERAKTQKHGDKEGNKSSETKRGRQRSTLDLPCLPFPFAIRVSRQSSRAV
ncbi:hypothetical protein CMQ_5643 [Grosmannia clavigera kw1407]|uniref:Uncharacterized protein n=1 Tax=Grosmannia clavigera (strain kw1407 / UAMH 11150) TaxID=655863 RepID=F0XSL9_GROCL|nr:uncharacterized protein CMQ_5643 [Grosmannia clavigera kw1407]EFW99222.1 hypothetical protein CMQ_5643 [Grosmannia clavigera kw1407]